jgi:hypothetical protein
MPQPRWICTPVTVTPSRRQDARDGRTLPSGPTPVTSARAIEETDAKEGAQQEIRERDEGIRNQLGKMDQRWKESQARQEAQDARCQEMFNMVAKIVEDREADRVRSEEERIVDEGRPGRFPVCAFDE